MKKFISSEKSDLKVGDKVAFTDNKTETHEVVSIRHDSYGRMYIGIQWITQIVEYPNTSFVQII